jgi:hypothetical protein
MFRVIQGHLRATLTLFYGVFSLDSYEFDGLLWVWNGLIIPLTLAVPKSGLGKRWLAFGQVVDAGRN